MTEAAPAAAARTLLEVLRLSTQYLAQHGSDSARLDAELLCAQALGLRRLDLYLQFDRPLRADELEAVRALLRRRAAGEPVAYITGVREFYGRNFTVTPAVLIPRPDTETLVELALRWAREREHPPRILDLGTGSGCIAVTLGAELPGASVVAVDISEKALEIAAVNAQRHGVPVRLVHGSWDAAAGEGPFDLVVSNPPYITDAEMNELPRDVREFEPEEALRGGADGLQAYRDIVAVLPSQLGRPWALMVEVDIRRAAAVHAMLGDAFAGGAPTTHADLTGRSRVVAVTG